MEQEFKVIGYPIPRLDSREIVTGKVTFGVDVALPGMLFGKVVRSPIPHGRILSIDVSEAERLPGVVAVVTAKDVLGNRFGFALKDETVFAVDKVRYIGDAVAAVAASDEKTAEKAAGLIRVEYDELPAVFDPVEAMRGDAPLVHPAMSTYETARLLKGAWKPVSGSNIVHRAEFAKGDVEKGFKEADLIFEDIFTTSQIHHCYIEPHAVVAKADFERITVWSCTQQPFPLRSCLAGIFGLPESKVRVISTKVGGGFGGKIAPRLEPYAVALSMKSGRPVKMVMTRIEEFSASAGSAPAITTIKTGVRNDGRLVAREMILVYDGGAYAEGLPPSNRALKDSSGPYNIPHIKIISTLVYTNKLRATPLRGLGVPEAMWAVESQMDMIARKLGVDPVEFRLMNALDEGDIGPTGEVVRSVSVKSCLRKAADAIGWGASKDRPLRGRAVVAIHKSPTTYGSMSGVVVSVNEDGSIGLFVGASDIGQGSDTVLAQIAAEELGVSLNEVSITSGDTASSPFDQGTFSSRVTLYTGTAVRNAVQDVKKRLKEIASKMLEVSEDDLDVGSKCVFVAGVPEKRVSFQDIAAHCHTYEGVILGKGWAGGQGDWPGLAHRKGAKEAAPGWKYGAQAVEVEVEPETGIVRVLKLVSVHDVGRAINPLAVKGQIEGGAIMGMSFGLFEELVYDQGKILNPTFMDYKIPTAMEIPVIIPIVVEQPLPQGPFGAKGIGELSILGIAPAIANAIYDAVGVRIKDLPLKPERILAALEEKGG